MKYNWINHNEFGRSCFLLFSLLLMMGIAACAGQGPKDSAAADPIQTSMEFRYDETQRQLNARIQFRKDSTVIKLEEDVRLSGSRLRFYESPILGPVYSVTRELEYDSLLTLEIGAEKFFIPVPRFDAPSMSTDFNKEKGGRLHWNGPLLANGEFLIILMEDSQKTVISLNRAGPSSYESTKIFPAQIDTLTVGPIDVNLNRRISYQDASGPYQAQITVEYFGFPFQFELKP
ncbi:MAG: hypothetical protein AAFV80_09310 [Bacteroidota bacterium]